MRLNVNSRIIVVLLVVTGLVVSAGYCTADSSTDEFNNSASGDTRVEIAWLGPKPSDQDMSDALDKYFIMSMPNQLGTTNLPLVVMGEHAGASASALKYVFQTPCSVADYSNTDGTNIISTALAPAPVATTISLKIGWPISLTTIW